MPVFLSLHIAAGAIGLISGFIALYAKKGAKLHVDSGLVFVYSMMAMGLLGSGIAAWYVVHPNGHAGELATSMIGALTAYLVLTAFTTVRRPTVGARSLDAAGMTLAIAIGVALVSLGGIALGRPRHVLDGFPSPPYFIFGTIALIAGLSDIRVVTRGPLRGTPRLARHLWRMCTAMLIAAFSFFIGQAKVIPKPIRIFPMLMIPPLIVLAVMLYWMWRVRAKGARRGVIVTRAAAT